MSGGEREEEGEARSRGWHSINLCGCGGGGRRGTKHDLWERVQCSGGDDPTPLGHSPVAQHLPASADLAPSAAILTSLNGPVGIRVVSSEGCLPTPSIGHLDKLFCQRHNRSSGLFRGNGEQQRGERKTRMMFCKIPSQCGNNRVVKN